MNGKFKKKNLIAHSQSKPSCTFWVRIFSMHQGIWQAPIVTWLNCAHPRYITKLHKVNILSS